MYICRRIWLILMCYKGQCLSLYSLCLCLSQSLSVALCLSHSLVFALPTSLCASPPFFLYFSLALFLLLIRFLALAFAFLLAVSISLVLPVSFTLCLSPSHIFCQSLSLSLSVSLSLSLSLSTRHLPCSWFLRRMYRRLMTSVLTHSFRSTVRAFIINIEINTPPTQMHIGGSRGRGSVPLWTHSQHTPSVFETGPNCRLVCSRVISF